MGRRRARSGEVQAPKSDEYEPTGYSSLIRTLREVVDELIPRQATVLVASKGDPELLAMGDRTAWHFPRSATGEYAGFHPADSSDAIFRLETLRQGGAQYLVVPSTSGWWSNFYAQFFEHLRSRGRVLYENPDVGMIFELEPPSGVAAVPPGASQVGHPPDQQLISLLDAVLPDTATVAAIVGHDSELISRPPRRTFVFRYCDDGATDSSAAIVDLQSMAAGSADFLVVPSSSQDWLRAHPVLAEYVDTAYKLVTNQRHVCRIYDLATEASGRS